jgi:carbohydrate binding protein with CBM5/12 domain
VLPTLPEGTFPNWSPATIYTKDDRVLHHGIGYRAKWWTQGDLPGADVLNPADTPWGILTTATPAATTRRSRGRPRGRGRPPGSPGRRGCVAGCSHLPAARSSRDRGVTRSYGSSIVSARAISAKAASR